jgi:hypothetical protein
MSKQSVKSKVTHVAVSTSRFYKGVIVEWTGKGAYIYHLSTGRYEPVHEMHDLEFKLFNLNFGEVVGLNEENTTAGV